MNKYTFNFFVAGACFNGALVSIIAGAWLVGLFLLVGSALNLFWPLMAEKMIQK